MARVRRRQVQIELFPARKKRRAKRGKRLGRPPKGSRAGSPHKTRPALDAKHPAHVVLRVALDVTSLRKRDMYAAIREATIAVAKRELNFAVEGAFRIVHISLQRNHVHLLVEAAHKMALSRGMQSFQISAAKHINAAITARRGARRRGAVFPDRFHQEIIKNPTQARRALSYVLNNWRKHREDRGELSRTWNVDPFSTGAVFGGWRELEGTDWMWRLRETYRPMVVYLAKTWLLREGWKRAGPISFRDVPSSRPVPAAQH